MRESDIQNQIMIALSSAGCTVWRNNVGTGWQGKMQRLSSGAVVLHDPRPLHAGLCVGSSDVIGMTPVMITPDMVGRTIGVFTAVEVKTKNGKPTDEQIRFIEAVRRKGGIAGVARSVEDALQLLQL